MSWARSALVAPIEEAELVVAGHRWRLDPRAAAGLRAHVSVLAPFVPPPAIDAAVIARLEASLRASEGFDCVFDQARWFDLDCLWLAPVAEAPFRRLTEDVRAAFPELEPYAGRRPAVPHLTVGFARSSSVDDLRIAAAQLGRSLPIRARVRRLDLLVVGGPRERWRRRAGFDLGEDAA